MHCNQYIPSKLGIDIQEDVHKHILMVRTVQCANNNFLYKKYKFYDFFEIPVNATI